MAAKERQDSREGVVKFPASKQPDVRGHHQSTKPKNQAGSIPAKMLQGPVPGQFLIATGAQVPPAIIKRVNRVLIGCPAPRPAAIAGRGGDGWPSRGGGRVLPRPPPPRAAGAVRENASKAVGKSGLTMLTPTTGAVDARPAGLMLVYQPRRVTPFGVLQRSCFFPLLRLIVSILRATCWGKPSELIGGQMAR